jgi:hypothetical protein
MAKLTRKIILTIIVNVLIEGVLIGDHSHFHMHVKNHNGLLEFRRIQVYDFISKHYFIY